MATIIQATQHGNNDRNQRWTRLERADLFAQYSELGLDHRVGHPTPFEPIPMLVAED
jgi:hypothetical protein